MATKSEKPAPKAEKADRVEVGFNGGQIVSARLTVTQLKELRKALGAGEGWHELETDDGGLALDLRQVVFVRATAPEHRVGFSG